MKNHGLSFALACLLVISAWGCQASPKPVTGAPGMGDPYYPNLGNGGYDVQNYTIALNIDPPANTVNGSTTITANATEYLSSFNLDFHSLTVDSVTVDDMAAQFSRNSDELTITPSQLLESGHSFTVVVKYHGSPSLIASQPIPTEMGWSHAKNGAINVWGEPDAASSWFPDNNHPRDKATYRFEITVPKPWMVAATGDLRETQENGDKTTFIWEMDKPMATYLASINIDQYETFTQSGPNGVIIRDYFPVNYPASLRSQFSILPAAINFFDDLFGPYPFDEYGVVVAEPEGVCEKAELALEAQSLSIHCPSATMAQDAVIVHELAHMWFGDSVSLENWQDVWLKEGFATYAEWLWASRNDPAILAGIARDNDLRFSDDPDFPVAKPSPEDLYTDESYTGGALVLQALRLEVGDETFFKILKTYTERYKYGNAGTDEFVAIAKEVSGRNLDPFFDAWLFSNELPQLPQ
jgi:aminopeptidase N